MSFTHTHTHTHTVTDQCSITRAKCQRSSPNNGSVINHLLKASHLASQHNNANVSSNPYKVHWLSFLSSLYGCLDLLIHGVQCALYRLLYCTSFELFRYYCGFYIKCVRLCGPDKGGIENVLIRIVIPVFFFLPCGHMFKHILKPIIFNVF